MLLMQKRPPTQPWKARQNEVQSLRVKMFFTLSRRCSTKLWQLEESLTAGEKKKMKQASLACL